MQYRCKIICLSGIADFLKTFVCLEFLLTKYKKGAGWQYETACSNASRPINSSKSTYQSSYSSFTYFHKQKRKWQIEITKIWKHDCVLSWSPYKELLNTSMEKWRQLYKEQYPKRYMPQLITWNQTDLQRKEMCWWKKSSGK